MSHIDENIIDMINKSQEGKNGRMTPFEYNLLQGVQKGIVTFDDETIEFEDKSILEDRVKIRVPKDFQLMSPEVAALKYPSERRPGIIFTNETTSINITFNHTKNPLKDSDIEEFKDTMMNIINKVQSSASVYENGVKNINGKNVGFFDFTVPAYDAVLYNFMFFVELEGKALLCSVNCTEDEMKYWRLIARGIMDSLTICSEENS